MELLNDLDHIIALNQEFELSDEVIDAFQSCIYESYSTHKRSFGWRETNDSYKILLSEIMLQQTQTDRVVPKYNAWIAALPDFESLAKADFPKVLGLWQGLGYNRRALALHKVAKVVVEEYESKLPQEVEQLKALPGIGNYTAAAICNFAFNKPTPLVETNIRAVYLHTFFADRIEVHDKELMPIISRTMDNKNSRDWFYALMDFGVMLKKQFKNPSRKSKHHTLQSKFEGSDRQIRGKILRILLKDSAVRFERLCEVLDEDSITRLEELMIDLFPYEHGCPANNCGNPISWEEDGCSDHPHINP